jgi:hypothetical protein
MECGSENFTAMRTSHAIIDFYIPVVTFVALLGVYFLILGIALAALASARRTRAETKAARRTESFGLDVGCDKLLKYREFVYELPKFAAPRDTVHDSRA